MSSPALTTHQHDELTTANNRTDEVTLMSFDLPSAIKVGTFCRITVHWDLTAQPLGTEGFRCRFYFNGGNPTPYTLADSGVVVPEHGADQSGLMIMTGWWGKNLDGSGSPTAGHKNNDYQSFKSNLTWLWGDETAAVQTNTIQGRVSSVRLENNGDTQSWDGTGRTITMTGQWDALSCTMNVDDLQIEFGHARILPVP